MNGSVNRSELEAVELIRAQRWAALGTIGEEGPLASMVAYVAEPDSANLLMFLSRLSQHTRNLLADPRASLAVAAPDSGVGDPQTLPRISLTGTVRLVERSAEDFGVAWRRYVERFPDAAPRLGLGDFDLFRLEVEDSRYVGGFARARSIPAARLAAAARSQEA